jgi:hypothetical protein
MQCNVCMPIACVPRALGGEVSNAAARLRPQLLGNVAPRCAGCWRLGAFFNGHMGTVRRPEYALGRLAMALLMMTMMRRRNFCCFFQVI